MSDTTFQAAAYTAMGTPREQVPLPGELFDGTVNMPVMHRVVKAYLANQREGNASTKTRGFVIGGNQKPWRQKGTGRARQGSTRSPLWPGGGTVFGPLPRSYDEHVPRKMKVLARKSALNARARENAIFLIDRFAWDAPRTRSLVGLIQRLGVEGQKVLVLTDGSKPNVYLSGRNLQRVRVLPYSDVSTYHLLWSDVVLIEATAIGQTLEPIAETEPSAAPRRAAKKDAAAPRAEAAPKAKKKASARAKKVSAKAKKAAPKKAVKAAAKAPAKKKKKKKKTTTAPKKSAPKKKGK
jgi:large subunit ribosomal protein L4